MCIRDSASEVVVGECWRDRSEIVLAVVQGCLVVEVRGGPPRRRCPLGVKEADDQLGHAGLLGYAAAGPRGAEVRNVPAAGDEAVERGAVRQDGLHLSLIHISEPTR